MAIEPITGFYVHDEVTDTDGVAKVSIEAVQEFEDDIRDETANWLENNPDIWNPIPDDSLTTDKYKDESITLAKIKKGDLGYVTPEMFGAVGDGTTDDTAAFKSALASENVVLIQNKTYKLTSPVIGEDCEVICDNGVYPIVKPIYPKSFSIKSFSEFEKFKSITLPNVGGSYAEGVTYDTNKSKLVFAIRNYSPSETTVLAIVDPETGAIENTYSYNISIVNNVVFNKTLNAYMVQCYTTTPGVWLVNAETMELSSSAMQLPVDYPYWAYDNAAHIYAGTKLSNGVYYVNLYDDDFEFLKEFEIMVGSFPQQGVDMYNGLLYQATWQNLLEIDVVSETLNMLEFKGANEIEDFCKTGDNSGFMISHAVAMDGYEQLYKFETNKKAVINYNTNQSTVEVETDVNLNSLLLGGIFKVSSSAPTTYNFPNKETNGLLIVVSSVNQDTLDYNVVKQFFVSTANPFTIYTRQYVTSWTAWKILSSQVLAQNINDSVSVDGTYMNSKNVYVDKYGAMITVNGWIKGHGSIPRSTTLLSGLPVNAGQNKQFLMANDATGATYLASMDRNTNFIKTSTIWELGNSDVYLDFAGFYYFADEY